MEILILKIFFLFVAIVYTTSLVLRVCTKNNIPAIQVILFALGWTGFIVFQLLLK